MPLRALSLVMDHEPINRLRQISKYVRYAQGARGTFASPTLARAHEYWHAPMMLRSAHVAERIPNKRITNRTACKRSFQLVNQPRIRLSAVATVAGKVRTIRQCIDSATHKRQLHRHMFMDSQQCRFSEMSACHTGLIGRDCDYPTKLVEARDRRQATGNRLPLRCRTHKRGNVFIYYAVAIEDYKHAGRVDS